MLDHQALEMPAIAGRSTSNGWRAKTNAVSVSAAAAAAAMATARGTATAQESEAPQVSSVSALPSRPTPRLPLQQPSVTLQRSTSKVRFVDLGQPEVGMLERVNVVVSSSPAAPPRGLTTTSPEQPSFFPRRLASISTRTVAVTTDQSLEVGHPASSGIRRSKTLPKHSISPSFLKHLQPGAPSLSAAQSGNTTTRRAQAIERVATPTIDRTTTTTTGKASESSQGTLSIHPATPSLIGVNQPAFSTTSVQPLIPKRSASKALRTGPSTPANMALVTPAPIATQRGGNDNQEYSQHNGSILQSQSPPPPLPRQRTLKTSKSVDGLSRVRSHTADSSMQPLTRQLQHLFVDSARTASPSLSQSQIDAYNQTPSTQHHLQQPPSSSGSGSSSATAESQYQYHDNHPYHGQQPSYSRNDDIYGGTAQFTSSGTSGAGATAGGGSIYQGLSVPASQIASRSTPKLTLFDTPPLSQNTYKDSKETRSFGGQSSSPSDHANGPRTKSKSTHLKPIPPPQNKGKEDEEHVERDQYGFKKESQWLSHHDFVIFEAAYVPVMERRRQKWAIFMNDSHGELPPRSAKLKRYIRKGIPPALRGDAWFVYSGAKDKCDANPGLYNRLVSQAKRQGQANEHADVIERDLHRTFPENINFKSQVTTSGVDGSTQLNTDNVAAIQSLRRVLLAFSLHCPSIGYCQSLNYIAGMLLLFMEEEHAFWTLSVITQNFLPEGMYDVTMEGANIDQAVLMTLVMERLPHIWTKFSNGATNVELDEGAGLPTVTLVTSHWFLTLFINILPVESVLRVWDCFFYEGRKILFRVALTVLKMHESEITKIDDPLEVFQVVQNIPKRLIDCHKLMETCFKRVGAFDLTTKDIDRRYNHFRTKRRLARAASTSSRGGGTGANTARRP